MAPPSPQAGGGRGAGHADTRGGAHRARAEVPPPAGREEATARAQGGQPARGAAGHDTDRGRGCGRLGAGGRHPGWPQKPRCVYFCIGFQTAGSGKCTAVLLNGSKYTNGKPEGLQLESPSACLYIQSSMRGRAQPLQMETPRPTARSAGPATDRPRESAGHGGGARLGGLCRAERALPRRRDTLGARSVGCGGASGGRSGRCHL